MKGVDLRTVANLMGHRDIEMTMRYAYLGPDHLQAAVDALDTRGGDRAQAPDDRWVTVGTVWYKCL